MNRTKSNFKFSFEFNDNSCANKIAISSRNITQVWRRHAWLLVSRLRKMRADVENLKERASWCLLVNVTVILPLTLGDVMHLTKENITESELILLRAGYFRETAKQVENMLVCQRHRANLGKEWGNQTGRTACPYREHQGKLKGVKSDQVVTVKMTREVMEVFSITIPVGSHELQLLITFCLFVFVSSLPDIHRNTRGIWFIAHDYFI